DETKNRLTEGPTDISEYTLEYGKILDIIEVDDTLDITALVEYNESQAFTVEQNYDNIYNLIKDQGASDYNEINYTAVIEEYGQYEPVVSFTITKHNIERVAQGHIDKNLIVDVLSDIEYGHKFQEI
ncbi:MAG: hypothetical protein LUB61_07175, partial [Eggerthellaceae bacterium]|nr:hypothetical protein [Eggerthellaceae bacterium]